MAGKTGIWTVEEALEHHDFSYLIAKFIGGFLPKDQVLTDWGCGKGSYLRYWHDVGFKYLFGIEGEHLPFFEFGNIDIYDLTTRMERAPIGNSVCLEVGEHIPKEFESVFIDNLVTNTKGKLIISWAIPGQAGIGHVNCQHNVYIVKEFEKRGMRLNIEDTLEIRQHVENRLHYFRDTLMIFDANV